MERRAALVPARPLMDWGGGGDWGGAGWLPLVIAFVLWCNVHLIDLLGPIC